LPFGLGDWVSWKAVTNNEYTSTAYSYLDHTLMARFAGLTGKDPTPYEQKATRLKELINTKFFNAAANTYAEGTQTAQALALYLGIVPESKEEAVAAKLKEVVAANDHFLDFGLLGSKTVLAMLTQYGYVEDAMKMVLKTDAPSWGYWVETMGYSTLPETWTLNPEFHDASLNHVFMGDVSAWMMNRIAGINYDESKPGFRNILITPHFVKELDWAEGAYWSVNGYIYSYWKREEGQVTLEVNIPANCTADIIVNGVKQSTGSGLHTFTYRD
jgi:alpha-L-rhamnosidase